MGKALRNQSLQDAALLRHMMPKGGTAGCLSLNNMSFTLRKTKETVQGNYPDPAGGHSLKSMIL